MKKTLKTLLALMAGTMALGSCSDDAIVENNIPQEPEQTESKLVPMTFTAHQENTGDTRTTIDGTSIKWSQLDKISIFDGSAQNCGNQCFTLTSGENTTSGVFQGEAAEGAGTYYAIYPYVGTLNRQYSREDCINAGITEAIIDDVDKIYKQNENSSSVIIPVTQHIGLTPAEQKMVYSCVTYTHDAVTIGPQQSGSTITEVEMPAVQTITAGKSVDASAMLMMAKSTEGTNDLKFKNVVSYFKFTAPFDCSKVQIFDNAMAGKMAGTVTLTYTDDEPTATVTGNGSSSVTLTGSIMSGETYYIATLPQTFSQGITMFFVKSDDGTEYAKRTSSSYQLGRNKVSNMGIPALTSENIFTAPYVTLSAESSQTLTLSRTAVGLEYSVGDGAWTALVGKSPVTFGGTGNNLRLRGTNGYGTSIGITISRIGFANNNIKVACTGDIRTLIDYRNHETVSTAKARFQRLFYNDPQLTSAPALPATELAPNCYEGMFRQCSGLTVAPELPATTLAERCYSEMFYQCSSLTTAPELPATTLVSHCYYLMFNGCNKLNYVKAAFTTTPGDNYTQNWLQNVASTGTFVKSPAATWDVTGVSGVPAGWTVTTE